MLPEWFYQLGIMGWPLAACSVLTVAIAVERAVFFIRARRQQADLINAFSQGLHQHQHQPKAVRDDLISLQLQALHGAYYSGSKPLRLIGTISPILGLLGTVLGIIKAFQVIAGQTGAVAPNMIADGLWEAMLTTAAGLMIALPALLLAQLFRHYADSLLQDMCLNLNQQSLALSLTDAPAQEHRQAA